MQPQTRILLAASALMVLAGCSSSDETGNPQPLPGNDASVSEDGATSDQVANPETGPDTATQDATEEDAVAEAEAGPMPTVNEKEPNDGKTDGEFNALPLSSMMLGAIGVPGDVDIFRFDATAGKAYTVSLELPSGSLLKGHLTVMDDGRDGHANGDDFVKIVRGTSATIMADVLAMGQGGYYVVVRDSRNVDGQTPSVGAAGFDYKVWVVERPTQDFEGAALKFPVNLEETLASRGAMRLYPFDGTEGTDVLFDLKAKGDMDGRLLVFAKSTGSWIARNDDRAQGDPNPLIDAPLTASGAMWLVVENISETAANLSYTLDGTMP
jgi:hypothetical protein